MKTLKKALKVEKPYLGGGSRPGDGRLPSLSPEMKCNAQLMDVMTPPPQRGNAEDLLGIRDMGKH